MPENNENFKKIPYYDRKNRRYVLPILKLLAKDNLVLTEDIARKIKTEKNIHGTKIQLRDLERLEYCESYGMVSNEKHVCEKCGQSANYLVAHGSLEQAKQLLEKDRKRYVEKSKQPDFDPKHYHICSKGFVLGRLVWLECKRCRKHVDSHMDEEYKVTNKVWWELTENGQYVFLGIYKNNQLWNFIEKNQQNKVFGLIHILHQNHENNIVWTLIDKLKHEMRYSNKLWKTVIPWYTETVEDVFNSKYSDWIRNSFKDYLIKYHPDDWENRLKIHR